MKNKIKMTLACALMGMTALAMAHPYDRSMPHPSMTHFPDAQVKIVLSQNDMLERFLTLKGEQKALLKDYMKARELYARAKAEFFKNHRPALDTQQKLQDRYAHAKFEVDNLEPLMSARSKLMASLETEQKFMVEKLESAFERPNGFGKHAMNKKGPGPKPRMLKPEKNKPTV